MSSAVLRARTAPLLLSRPMMSSAEDIIGHFGCVQAQDFAMAKWAVARRGTGLTDDSLNADFNAGRFLRVHVLRPTWHFVLPVDLGWIMALTAPRVARILAVQNKQQHLTAAELDRAADVIVAALTPGHPLTRSQLAEQLLAAGVDARGIRLANIVMHAELHTLICNGPLIGKQHSYRLAPPATFAAPDEDEVLARLARRYVRGHGPAQPRDLSWWSSLTVAQSRRAFELAGLRRYQVDGQEFWADAELLDVAPAAAALLPPWDEAISYVDKPVDPHRFGPLAPDLARGSGLLFVDGVLAGSWRRTTTAESVRVAVTAAGALNLRQRRAITADAERFAAFLGTALELRVGD